MRLGYANVWVIKILSSHRKAILAIVSIQIVCGILISLQPRYYQQLVTLVIGGADGQMMSRGIPVVGLLTVIYILAALFHSLGGYIGVLFSSNLLKQLQIQFFENTAHLPLGYFNNQSSGELYTKFNTDIGAAQKFMASIVPEIVREIVVGGCVVTILLYHCPLLLTVATLVIALVASMAIRQMNRVMRPYEEEQREGWGRINRTFDETVRGIDILKLFRAEEYMQNSFLRHTHAFRNVSVRAGTIVSVFSPIIDLTTKFGGLLPLFLAYYLISKGNIELEPFLLFFFYSALLNISIANLAGKLANIQTEMTGIRNLATFFSETTEPEEPDGINNCIFESVPIRITGLTFAYPARRTLYQNADLFIPEKATTLIHGESGSGKSTLINLLLRFATPQEGDIILGNNEISTISRNELRKNIGVVSQNHFIFHDTLRENLLVAKPDASDEELIDALKSAQLEKFFNRLPEGLDTQMGYQGRDCSGGEKQRICIARLLVRQSPVMILDEPWTNVDRQARNILSEVVNSCKQKATVVILTHETPEDLSVDRAYRIDTSTGMFVNLT